jgi:hypothetical protein
LIVDLPPLKRPFRVFSGRQVTRQARKEEVAPFVLRIGIAIEKEFLLRHTRGLKKGLASKPPLFSS